MDSKETLQKKNNTKTEESQGFSGKIPSINTKNWAKSAQAFRDWQYPNKTLLTFYNGMTFRYDREYNYYEAIILKKDRLIASQITRWLANKDEADNYNFNNALSFLERVTTVKKRIDPKKLTKENSRHWLAFKDGWLHVSSNIFIDKNSLKPPIFLTSALPIEYDKIKNVSDKEVSDARRILEGWLDGDSVAIKLALQILGYCFTPRTNLQCFFSLFGPPASGKSTFVSLLSQLVGEEFVAALDAANFSSGRFGLQILLGKTVATLNDLRQDQLTAREKVCLLNRILNIAGEDKIFIDIKKIDPISTTLDTKIIITSNELLDLPDPSGALRRRHIPLYFPKSYIGKEDRDLENRLKGLLPAFYKLTLEEGLRSLLDEGKFCEPTNSKDIIDATARRSAPLFPFIPEKLVEAQGNFEPTKKLYGAYKEFCEEKGIEPLAEKLFSHELKKALPLAETAKRRYEGKPTWGRLNVKLL